MILKRLESGKERAAEARAMFGACSPPAPSKPWQTAHDDSNSALPLLLSLLEAVVWALSACDLIAVDGTTRKKDKKIALHEDPSETLVSEGTAWPSNEGRLT